MYRLVLAIPDSLAMGILVLHAKSVLTMELPRVPVPLPLTGIASVIQVFSGTDWCVSLVKPVVPTRSGWGLVQQDLLLIPSRVLVMLDLAGTGLSALLVQVVLSRGPVEMLLVSPVQQGRIRVVLAS